MDYAGDLSPTDTYAALAADERAVLVDVRTAAEWTYVGLPDLTPIGKQALTVEWQHYPAGTLNAAFVDDLLEAGVEPGQPVYFLCRSGVRSVHAATAATAAGLGPAYNVLDGFEGPHDGAHHRTVSGWKVAGLPWRQG
ncbi:MAG: rhodanese-like domain-containing protein [Dermatophilaceae bacterium]